MEGGKEGSEDTNLKGKPVSWNTFGISEEVGRELEKIENERLIRIGKRKLRKD